MNEDIRLIKQGRGMVLVAPGRAPRILVILGRQETVTSIYS